MDSSDVDMVNYFWMEMGDLERWSEWAEKRGEFLKVCPELIKAHDDYQMAIRVLTAIVRGLEVDS